MANEESPGWAQQLLLKVANSFEWRFDERGNSMKHFLYQSTAVRKVLKELTKEVNYLQTKLTNLEAHSKRNNLIFLGLETGRPDKLMSEVLRYILDLKGSDPTPEVERQHRSLSTLPCFNRRRGGMLWVYQDLPTEIRRKRAQYDDIRGNSGELNCTMVCSIPPVL